MKFRHWKSHWKFVSHWKKKTRKSHWKIFRKETTLIITLKYFPLLSKYTVIRCKFLDHTEKLSALLISFILRIFSVTLDFQCDFQCHSFMNRLWNSYLNFIQLREWTSSVSLMYVSVSTLFLFCFVFVVRFVFVFSDEFCPLTRVLSHVLQSMP